jgi:pilus assembly protein CpaF
VGENPVPIEEVKKNDPPMTMEIDEPKSEEIPEVTAEDIKASIKKEADAVKAEKEKKKTPKKIKSMDDDTLLEDEEEVSESEDENSVTSLRLQRARNRIWLDLRPHEG